jgi:hypothetical protein
VPLRTTASHAVFRLAIVDDRGEPAGARRLLVRWAIVWLPLLVPMALVGLLVGWTGGAAYACALVLLLLWIGAAASAVIHPNRGWHDRMARTWVVRR